VTRSDPITIGDRTFRTLGEAQDAVRAILYAYEPPATVTDVQHQLLLTAVVAMHPEADAKIGAGVDHFDVRMNFRSPGFWIVRVDSTETVFSFLKELRPPDGSMWRCDARWSIRCSASADRALAETDAVACPNNRRPRDD
jgi:hypothetical protein